MTPNRRPTIPPTHSENRKSVEALNTGMLELQGFMAEPQRAVRLGELLDAGLMEMTPTGVAQRKDSLYVLKAGDAMPGWLTIGSSMAADRPLVVWSTTNPLAAGESSVMVVGSLNKERFEARTCGGATGGFVGKCSGGTDVLAPTATPNATSLAQFGGCGFDGADWVAGMRAAWRFNATQLWTSTAHGTRATLATTANGTTAMADRFEMRAGGMARFLETADVLLDVPGANRSVEITYRADGAQDQGQVVSYDRGTATYKPLRLEGSELQLFSSGVQRGRIDANGLTWMSGHIRSTTMHDNATLPSGAATQYVASGTYTPVLTNVANVAASTAYVCQWLRVGNVVTVSGKVDIDPSATATNTELGISLPIPSAFVAEQQCGGVAVNHLVASLCAQIEGDTANDRAKLRFIHADASNRNFGFSFTYLVL